MVDGKAFRTGHMGKHIWNVKMVKRIWEVWDMRGIFGHFPVLHQGVLLFRTSVWENHRTAVEVGVKGTFGFVFFGIPCR